MTITAALETAYNTRTPVTVEFAFGTATVKANPDASYASITYSGSSVRLAVAISGKTVITADDAPTYGNEDTPPDIIASVTADNGADFYANIEAAHAALVK
jgi:hypothetical protein